MGEQLCRHYHQSFGQDYVVLRYSTVYGERQHYRAANSLYIMETYDLIRSGKAPVLPGDGTDTKHFVYVTDVARANIAALQSTATDVAVNVSGPARLQPVSWCNWCLITARVISNQKCALILQVKCA